jgi:NRAMP (natural resistance-associated macrophage protein)-like metal ion transporter
LEKKRGSKEVDKEEIRSNKTDNRLNSADTLRTSEPRSDQRITSTEAQTPTKKKSIISIFGPGVITGASDDDPSGIATYSQAGAQFGLGMLWMILFLYPLMSTVQEICARLGLITGNGLAGIIKKRYSRKIVYPIASLVLIANIINIGADIAAMAASIRLIFPQLPVFLVSLSFTAFIVISEIMVPYQRYVKILKYLTLSLFAYLITTIIVGGNLQQILMSTIVPNVQFSSDFIMMFVAIAGTTISPYLFFWQASEEAEEEVAENKIKDIGMGKPKVSKQEVKLMRADVAIGMAFAQLIMWGIIVTTAGSLHNNGITDIQTAEQAATALEPLVKSFPEAGVIAKTIFALGIVGTGLLAIPVLAGSCGYVLSDAFGWKQGLGKKFRQAKYFYLVISAATITGFLMNFANIDPIKALVYAAVINGTVSVPLLFIIMKLSNDTNILGNKTNSRLSNILGWAAFVIMSVAVIMMFALWTKY